MSEFNVLHADLTNRKMTLLVWQTLTFVKINKEGQTNHVENNQKVEERD